MKKIFTKMNMSIIVVFMVAFLVSVYAMDMPDIDKIIADSKVSQAAYLGQTIHPKLGAVHVVMAELEPSVLTSLKEIRAIFVVNEQTASLVFAHFDVADGRAVIFSYTMDDKQHFYELDTDVNTWYRIQG